VVLPFCILDVSRVVSTALVILCFRRNSVIMRLCHLGMWVAKLLLDDHNVDHDPDHPDNILFDNGR
jgi:hypothetical protein